MLPESLRKYGAIQFISDEQLYVLLGSNDSHYIRKHVETTVPPNSEDWWRYHQAVQGLRALQAYEGMDWGSPESEPEVEPPRPKVTFEWLETHDEWIARCHALRQAEKAGQ